MVSTPVLTEKIKIGISACNFGAQVRWNHRGWDRLEQIGRERLSYSWTPVCPEVNAGLGVPRRPMALVGNNGHEFWRERARLRMRGGRDVSEEMREGMLASLGVLQRAGIQAFIFMEGSPSCGVYRTSLRGTRIGHPPGAFGSLLLNEGFFLIPALDMESPVKWWDWRRRLHAFIWLTEQELDGKGEIYDAWHQLKFLCQEVDDQGSRKIGRELAAMPRRLPRSFVEQWRREVLGLLRRPSTYRRIRGIMAKHYAHYRRHLGLSGKEMKLPHDTVGKRQFVKELRMLERKAHQQGHEFGGAPVDYRVS